MDISALLPSVIVAARESGALILSLYNSGNYKAQNKDDSPVTDADWAAHEFLQQALREIADIPVLSEEVMKSPWLSATAGRATGWWIHWMALKSLLPAAVISRP